MTYPDLLNPDLLDRIPLTARRILDVGCGTGALGLAYKQRNPAARVFGIELDPDPAAIAATRLDEVAVCDVEATPDPFGGAPFDCIIYGDVLEHLRDPWTLLATHARLLAPSGTVLVCMPNAEHWSFAARLLRGAWGYDDQGLFDRSHLRWFTGRTTREALVAAGLAPYDVAPRVFDGPTADEFARVIAPALAALGVDAAEYLTRARPLQHVWRARRVETPTMQVVSSMLTPVGGVSEVRVTEPMQALASEPGFLTRILRDVERDIKSPVVPRIFVLHRPLLAGPSGLDTVRSLIADGYLVVCEFDDLPAGIPVLQRPDVHNFRAVHAIQTTTEPLAAAFRLENPEVGLFPNAIRTLEPPGNFADPGRLTLFFGGINREQDWPPYIEALNNVAAFMGPRLAFEIVADRGLFDALRTEHKRFTPLCDYATYRALLGACEISWMPLADNAFNRCKSDLKFIEAAAHRVAALASRVVYSDSIEDGRTGALFDNPMVMQQRLARLVAQPEQARAIADAARAEIAATRMLAYQVGARADWYRSLWERREALTEALYSRVPELRAG